MDSKFSYRENKFNFKHCCYKGDYMEYKLNVYLIYYTNLKLDKWIYIKLTLFPRNDENLGGYSMIMTTVDMTRSLLMSFSK